MGRQFIMTQFIMNPLNSTTSDLRMIEHIKFMVTDQTLNWVRSTLRREETSQQQKEIQQREGSSLKRITNHMNMRSKIQHIENYGEKQINTFFFLHKTIPTSTCQIFPGARAPLSKELNVCTKVNQKRVRCAWARGQLQVPTVTDDTLVWRCRHTKGI